MAIQLLFLFLAILAVAFFTAAETALSNAPQSQLRQHIKRDSRAIIALKLIHTDHLLPILRGVVILLAMAIAVVHQGTFHTIFLKLFTVESPESINSIFSTIPLALIILIFSVFIPYVVASKYPFQVALFSANTVFRIYKLSMPFTLLFDWMTGHVAGLDGAGIREMDRDELNLQIRLAGKDKRISAIESELASNALKLSERRIGSMMTPRTNLHAIDIHDTPETVRNIINTAPHSRYPLVDGELENLAGIIELKDLIAYVLEDGTGERKSLLANSSPYVMIPDSTNALALLELLKSNPTNMAIAFDEYGNVTGVVTLYDLIENIAGGVAHNNENEPQKSMAAHSRSEITPRSDGSFLIDGAMDISDFFEAFHMEERIEELQENGAAYTTVAGYVLAGLGHIPQIAEVLEIDSLKIEIVDMDGNRIDKLMITKMHKEVTEDFNNTLLMSTPIDVSEEQTENQVTTQTPAQGIVTPPVPNSNPTNK